MRKPKANSPTKREAMLRERVAEALGAMRRGLSFARAASENRVSTRTIKKYAGSALIQERQGGRIRAAKSDRLTRYLLIPGPNGPREITARGLKIASEVARYKAAVNRFLRGDRDAMTEWHGKKLAGIELITDAQTLKNLADKGLLPYSLYRSFNGGAK